MRNSSSTSNSTRRIAILIGVDEYKHPWGHLQVCKNDVERLQQVLSKNLGSYCFDEIIPICGKKATSEQIKITLEEVFVNEPPNKDDLILFYFSGHGYLHKKGRTKGLLITQDTSSTAPFHNALDMEQLKIDYFNTCPCNVLFIIDSCYSGSIINQSTTIEFARTTTSLLYGNGKAIITSCSEDAQSFTREKDCFSKFTFHLINGLNGDYGSTRPDKSVTFESLTAYLDEKLKIEDQTVQRAYLLQKGTLILSIPPKKNSEIVVKQDVDFTEYVQQYIVQYDSVPPGSNNSYIQLSSYNNLKKERIEDTDEFLIKWIRSHHTLITIFGDTGTGKSTVVKRLKYNLSKESIKGNTDRIPILIELKEFNRIQDIVALIINKMQIDYGIRLFWDQVLNLVKQGKFVFILDGFDEMLVNVSEASISNNLSLIEDSLFAENAKIILTCRRNYLRNDAEIIELLKQSKFTETGFDSIELSPFTEDDVRLYIFKSVTNESTQKDCLKFLNDTKSLSSLKTRPILLEMLIKELPNLLKTGDKVTPDKIYTHYVRGWVNRDRWRFDSFIENFKDDLEKIFERIYGDKFIAEDLPYKITTTFIKELSWFLYEKGNNMVSYKRLPSIIQEQLPVISQRILDFFDYSLRTCSFLTRDENGYYSFIDDSFHAFFLAKLFQEEIENHKPRYFGKKKLDPIVAQFLSNLVVDRTETLKDWIKDNKLIEDGKCILKYLGGNSATLLNLINNHNFKGDYYDKANFRGANLIDADFTNSKITDTILSESEMINTIFKDVVLSGCEILDVDFQGCTLSGVTVNGDTKILNARNLDKAIDVPENFEMITERTKGLPEIWKKLTPEDLGMVKVPAGEFLMGSISSKAGDGEKPQHKIYLDEFWIDKFPVTNEQFELFVRAMPEWKKDPTEKRFGNVYYLSHWLEGGPNNMILRHPVVYVNWYAAKVFAEWQGKRLPSEAEWEKAVSGPSNGQHFEYPWGNHASDVPQDANYKNRIGSTTESGKNPSEPNKYDIFDMFGNVKEWCEDWYDENYYYILQDVKIVKNPQGPEDGEHKVLRGGSYKSSLNELRCSFRSHLLPVNTNVDGGFRCVLTP